MNPALLEHLLDAIAARIADSLNSRQPHESMGENGASPWMNIESAAAHLDWPRQRLYKLTAQNAIPHYKHEGRLLFNRQELDQWIRTHSQHRLDVLAEASYQSHAP
jgi:excisionase family DNA binding protein